MFARNDFALCNNYRGLKTDSVKAIIVPVFVAAFHYKVCFVAAVHYKVCFVAAIHHHLCTGSGQEVIAHLLFVHNSVPSCLSY